MSISAIYEFQNLVSVRLSARQWATGLNDSLVADSSVSASVITGIIIKLNSYLSAITRFEALTEGQQSLVGDLAKADIGDEEYDLSANLSSLKTLVLAIIAECINILPVDEDDYIATVKYDSTGVQSVRQISYSELSTLITLLDTLETNI